MIYRSLKPMNQKLHYYGNVFFYIMSIQVVNTPDGVTIDYVNGLTSSQSDTSCKAETRLIQEKETLL